MDKTGCSDTVSVKITQPTQITVTGVSRLNELCNGDNTGRVAISVAGGTSPYTYSWSNGETTALDTLLVAGTYTCTITDKNGCSISDTVNIHQPAAIAVASGNTTICTGAIATLNAIVSGGSTPYSYLWSTGSTATSITVSPTITTSYTITVTDANHCNGGNIDTVTISTSAPMTQTPIPTPPTVCAGVSDTLTDLVSGGIPPYTYIWSPATDLNITNGPTVIATPTATIKYFVVASGGCGASIKDSVTINIISAPTYTVCCDSTIIIGQSVRLIASPSTGYTFLWTPATGSSCDTCPNPVASPTVNTTYTVIATEPGDGCTTMDTVTIDIGNGKIVIYSGFTPNGDGHNDLWVIDNIELYNNTVTIFNRWGLEVWRGNNYNNSSVVWTGLNTSGQPLPDGTYFYIVQVDGTTYKGWVELQGRMRYTARNIIITLVIGLLPLIGLAQQDPQFTLFMFDKMALDPAAQVVDALEMNLMSRDQWLDIPGAPITNALTISGASPGKNAGWGFEVMNDQIGPTTSNTVQGDYAYNIRIGNGKLAMGLGIGVYDYEFNLAEIDYKDKNDISAMTSASTKLTPTAEAGLYYYSTSYYVGVSVNHLIESELTNITVDNSSVTFAPHMYLIAGKAFQSASGIIWNPSIIVQYVQNAPPSISANLNVLLAEKLWLGASYQMGYGCVFLIDYKASHTLSIGYAYDLGLNAIGVIGGGTHELAITLDFGSNKASQVSPRFF